MPETTNIGPCACCEDQPNPCRDEIFGGDQIICRGPATGVMVTLPSLVLVQGQQFAFVGPTSFFSFNNGPIIVDGEGFTSFTLGGDCDVSNLTDNGFGASVAGTYVVPTLRDIRMCSDGTTESPTACDYGEINWDYGTSPAAAEIIGDLTVTSQTATADIIRGGGFPATLFPQGGFVGSTTESRRIRLWLSRLTVRAEAQKDVPRDEAIGAIRASVYFAADTSSVNERWQHPAETPPELPPLNMGDPGSGSSCGAFSNETAATSGRAQNDLFSPAASGVNFDECTAAINATVEDVPYFPSPAEDPRPVQRTSCVVTGTGTNNPNSDPSSVHSSYEFHRGDPENVPGQIFTWRVRVGGVSGETTSPNGDTIAGIELLYNLDDFAQGIRATAV